MGPNRMRIEQPYGYRFDQGLGPIEPKYKYFIACEGKRTEYVYFKGLMRAKSELGIDPLIDVIPIQHDSQTGSHPLSILDETQEVLYDSERYFPETDTVCIIVDRDAGSFFPTQYEEMVEQSASLGFRLIVSNPCIELWLLLHYTDLSNYDLQQIRENRKRGNRTYTEILLKDDHLQGSYNKHRIQFDRNFKPYVHRAIKNSKMHATALDQLKVNVGTNIGLLIGEMLKEPADQADTHSLSSCTHKC